jgi:hypothetical protein
MKTVLQILVILLVAAIVAGGMYALVENTTLVSSSESEHGQPPAMTNADGSSAQMMERSEGGGEHGASFTRGLSEVLVMLGKLSGITVAVLLIQSLIARLRKRQVAIPTLK